MSVATYSDNWRTLQKYAHLFPQHFHLAHSIAKGFYADGNHANALKFYKKALLISSNNYVNWGHVGYCFELGEADYEKAIYHYLKAIAQLTAPDKWLSQRLAWCYIQSKQYQAALDVLLEHIQHVPTDDWAQGKIGYCHQMFSDYATALTYHLKAESIGASEVGWNTGNVGYCYQMLGDYATALAYHLKAEQIDSRDVWNLKNVGYCYQKAGDYTNSLAYHLRVYEEAPTDIWNVKNVGYSYQQLGNYEKALKYHEVVEKMAPTDTWNLGHMGYCYQRISKHKNAIPFHEKVLELAPDDTWNKYQLGYCYFTQYDLENAELHLQDGDDDKYAILHMGSIFLVQGKTYLALEKYKEALPLFDSLESFISVYNSDRVYLLGDYGLSATQCDQMAWEVEMHNSLRKTW